MAIYQKRVGDVFWDDGEIVYIDFSDIVNDVDSTSSWHVSWFYDPEIALRVWLLLLLEMIIEVTEFIRNDVGVGEEIKVLLSKLLLHFIDIWSQFVFSGYFKTLWKVVDFLKFIESFVEVRFAWATTPEYVPLMWLCVGKVVCFK